MTRLFEEAMDIVRYDVPRHIDPVMFVAVQDFLDLFPSKGLASGSCKNLRLVDLILLLLFRKGGKFCRCYVMHRPRQSRRACHSVELLVSMQCMSLSA